MSVRATQSLIAELVIVPGLPGSPVMAVQAVNEEEKTIQTVWFTEAGLFQQGTFPAKALDRAPEPKAAKAGPASKAKTPRGRRPAKK